MPEPPTSSLPPVKRAPLVLLLLVLAAAGAWFLFSKKAPEPEIGTRVSFSNLPAALADQFSGEKAYEHVNAIVDLGPRPPAGEGYQ